MELELIKIGSDLYLMNPFSQQWQALPPGTSNLESLDQFAVAEVFRAAGDLTYIGLDQIGGMDAWQLGATLTPEALNPATWHVARRGANRVGNLDRGGGSAAPQNSSDHTIGYRRGPDRPNLAIRV